MTDKEHSDFHYLLSLIPPLTNTPEFAWLPELFSIIGHEKLLTLCKYAGGETIKIPTLSELSNCIQALQWYYDIEIAHTANYYEVPDNIIEYVRTIQRIYADA